MRVIGLVLAAALGVGFEAAAARTVFKCQDEHGRLYFSDRKCPTDQQQQTLRVRAAPTPSGGAPRRLEESLKQRSAAADKRLKADRDKRTQLARAEEERRAKACKDAQQMLSRLESRRCYGSTCSGYAYTPRDENGNRYTATEQEKQDKIRALESQIQSEC